VSPTTTSPPIAQPDYSVQALIALAGAARHAELEALTQPLIARHPEDGVLWKILSVALAAQGKDALPALEKAAELLPTDAEAQTNLGNGLRARRLLDRALASHQRALALKPDYAQAHNNEGTVLRALGRMEDAVTSFRRAVAEDPTFIIAHFNLGDALFHSRQFRDSLVSFRRVIERKPDHAPAHHGAGMACLSLGHYEDALQCFRRATALKPDFAEAHNNTGVVLRQLGHRIDAVESCRLALKINPRLVAALTFMAQLKADEGDFAAARSHLEHALSIDPELPEAWAALANWRKMTSDDAAWLTQVRRLLAKPLTPRQEIPLRFALGKYLDDTGDFDAAFAAYRQANALTQRHAPPYDSTALRRSTDQLIHDQDRAWLERARNGANPSTRPIFIVGMPRSGTTLAEQILASHPAVYGASELSFWNDAARVHDIPGKDPQAIAHTLRDLADAYLETLDRKSATARKVTDKMPENFRHLGMIHAALPRARIIHLRRNPQDTCLSIYFQDFQASHAYASDLDHIADMYGHYQRLMAHWRKTLPHDAMLEVRYEDLVRDPEASIRRLLAFVGLEWEPACLTSHLTNRPISTFSKWQARQQINASSVDRWKQYARHCEPLMYLAEAD
jgi:tetratricopeptide (TPR) repeat protein